MEKKIVKKYAKLMHQAQQAAGRKEAVGLLHKAAKLKTKLVSYKIMQSYMINSRSKIIPLVEVFISRFLTQF